jgi:hypothetical protein
MYQVFWDFGSEAVGLEDSENLVSSNETDLGNTVGVTNYNMHEYN